MRRALAMPLVVPGPRRHLTLVERARVAAEIATTYCAARWWLLRLPFPAAVAAARRDAGSSSAGDLDAVRLGRAVRRSLSALPFDSRCLVTALVLTRMLARRGVDSTFVLGVRTSPSFAAHAWVERDGMALLPTTPDFSRLAEL